MEAPNARFAGQSHLYLLRRDTRFLKIRETIIRRKVKHGSAKDFAEYL
jgi:hypothetical protein